MTAAKKINRVSVEDFLAREAQSDVRHEYLGGFVYAMAGARFGHNAIVAAAQARLYLGLEGSVCQVCSSDMMVRIDMATHTRFYYPDVLVVCDPPALDAMVIDNPVLVLEVLSPSTRRIDTSEKREGYRAIPSLKVLLLVEQNRAEVEVHRRRGRGFDEEAYEGLDAVIPLPEIGTELPLAKLYERINLVAESSEVEPR